MRGYEQNKLDILEIYCPKSRCQVTGINRVTNEEVMRSVYESEREDE